MNRQEAIITVFDVLNIELLKKGCGSDTLAVAIVDALGIPAKPAPKPEPERYTLHGFRDLGDMTHDELLEECIAFQLKLWEGFPKNALQNMVIAARVNDYKNRLVAEAGIDDGPLGFLGMVGS